MSDVKHRVEGVAGWLADVSRRSRGEGGFEIRRALATGEIHQLNGKRDHRSVRSAVMKSLDGEGNEPWRYQGIYVWFWERKDSSPVGQEWPLYVGKTRAETGMRGRHLNDHTRYPTPDRGKKDMLCDPIESRRKNALMIFGEEGVLPAADCPMARSSDGLVGEKMLKQFLPMRVLLLPMSPKEISYLSDAEGVVIAASQLIHQEINRAKSGDLSCMMNSKGKASSLGLGFEALCERREMIEPIAISLRELLTKKCTFPG